MTDYDLCSAVFVLHSDRQLPAGRFLGRAANKLFLEMLNHVNGMAALATELHGRDGTLPFTVSDIFHSSEDLYWLRVTGLEPHLCQVIECLVEQLRGQTVVVPPRPETDDLPWEVKIEIGLLSQHDWAGQTTCPDLVQSAWRKPARQTLTLDFVTPTVLKSIGVYRPFPEPALFFRLLYERLLKLNEIALPFKPEVVALESFADYFISVTDYQVTCVPLDIKEGHETAFYGRVAYTLLRENDAFRKRAQTRQDRDHDFNLMMIHDNVVKNYDQYACLLNLLSEFAFYSGVGKETGQGKGMVRKVDAHGG